MVLDVWMAFRGGWSRRKVIRVLIMSRREHGGEKADQVRARCVPASHWPTYACGAQPDKAAESHASRRPRWTARGRPPRADRRSHVPRPYHHLNEERVNAHSFS